MKTIPRPRLFVTLPLAVAFFAFSILQIGATCNPPPQTGKDAAALLSCVLGKISNGMTDPVAIAEQCPGAEAAFVSDILQSLQARAAMLCASDAGPLQRSPASAGGR
jgi:hypothetical protein